MSGYVSSHTQLAPPPTRGFFLARTGRTVAGVPEWPRAPEPAIVKVPRSCCAVTEANCPAGPPILENPPEAEINRREQMLITERGTLNGPLL